MLRFYDQHIYPHVPGYRILLAKTLLGICILTYPAKRMATAEAYCLGERFSSSSIPANLAEAILCRSR